MGALGFPDEAAENLHDLRHPGFVVGPQQGAAVGGDQVVAHHLPEPGLVFGAEHRSGGQPDLGAVVTGVDDGVDAAPRHSGKGVVVRQQADGPRRPGGRSPGVRREGGGDHPVRAEAYLLQPHGLKLVEKQPGHVPLLGGGRHRGGALVRRAVHLHVTQELGQDTLMQELVSGLHPGGLPSPQGGLPPTVAEIRQPPSPFPCARLHAGPEESACLDGPSGRQAVCGGIWRARTGGL